MADTNIRSTLHAVTRALSPAIARCELTHVARAPIDYQRAVAQHRAYVALLQSLAVGVTTLAAEPELPDAVFIEDTAIVLDELAIITHPGASSRRPETASVAEALRPWRQLATIVAPGTLDGGDVLRVGRTLYVGRSSRSNEAGAQQLRAAIEPFGYRVVTVGLTGCLHLKSAVTAIDDQLLLINANWCDRQAFGAIASIDVEPSEPFGANVLRLEGCVVMAAGFKRTAARLLDRGVVVHTVDLSELAKAEGAVTCCSLVFSV